MADSVTALREQVRRIMEAAWRPAGYASPNLDTYPWQWLWDSGFHAVVWAALGDERGPKEIATLLALQTHDGFVPHMGYQEDPEAARARWARSGSSNITQPPMYAHALRVMNDQGFDVGEELAARAGAGLGFLWETRMRSEGLLVIVHPWESGCDDSARWDSWAPEPFTKAGWDAVKQDLVASLEVNEHGSAVANPRFEVSSAGFNALCAFNAKEYAALTGDDDWRARGDELAERIGERWDTELGTFVDDDYSSASAPTLDSLLGLLVLEPGHPGWEVVADPDRFAASYGLRGLDPHHAGYRPDKYWRGASWPQLDYLMWVAAVRAGRGALAGRIVETTTAGALLSGFAEYWDADTGQGYGAIPQTWAGLVLAMAAGVGP